MKYFKDADEIVFAFEADGSQDHMIPENLIPITDEEADALRFPALSREEIIAQYEHALDAHLDSVAQHHRYDNRFTFALRAGFAGPYQEEGIAFARWMDACNTQAFALLQSVISGEAELPSIKAMIASLPAFNLP